MPVTQMGGVQQNVAQYLMLMPYFQRTRLRERARAPGGGARARRADDRAPREGRGDGDHAAARDAARRAGAGAEPDRGRARGRARCCARSSRLPPTIEPAGGGAAARGGGACLHGRRRPRLSTPARVPRRRATCRARARRSRLRDLPDGEAWYAFTVRQMTTTRLTPQEIHDIGLAEVKRIRARDGRGHGRAPASTGTFAAVRRLPAHGRPRSSSTGAEDLLVAYRDICKRVDPELPKLFGHLPRLPYGVVPVPAYAEKIADDGLLRAGLAGRGPARLLLREHLRPARAAEVGDGGARPARGGARPSPADRAGAGAAGHAGVPPARLLHRVRRGLGALRREPGRARWASTRIPTRVRPAHLRDVARHPAGGGHGHARAGLEPRSRPSTTSPRTRARPSTTSWSRWTATSSGPARPSPTRSAS